MATDDRNPNLRNPGGDNHAEFDRDLNIRGVVWTGVGLAGITALGFVIAWFVFGGLADFEERQGPEPLPLPEAAERALPPGPRLQATPEEDLEALLAHEEALLEHYSVVEEGGEFARIPIERAMELVLERGVGPAPGEPQDGASPGTEGGMIPAGRDVDQPGTPPGGSPTAETTEGQDAQ